MEDNKPSIFRRIFKGEKSNKFKSLIVAMLIIAILVIFLSSLVPTQKKENKTTDDQLKTFSSLEYCAQVENRLKNVLSKVKGIGELDVFVMVESGVSYKYLEETETQESENGVISSKVTIYETKNGSITSPVVEMEILPKIIGVLIIAEGAKDAKLKVTLSNVVSNILDVDLSKVEVLEGK